MGCSRALLYHGGIAQIMSKRRKNQLQPLTEQTAVRLFKEAVPDFEEAERLFYADQKAKNRLKRTIAWHRENLHVFKKALREQSLDLDLEKVTHRTIKNNLVLYAIEKWGNKPQTVIRACAPCGSSSPFWWARVTWRKTPCFKKTFLLILGGNFKRALSPL